MKQALHIPSLVLCAVLAIFAGGARGAIDVFACEPEWAALVQELAADRAIVYSATTAQQDPHRIEARPSLIAHARRARLLVCTGAELEVGWLPVVLRQSANPGIQPGAPGYFLAAEHVRLLDVQQSVDRSAGDVHPAGNPHLHYDPRNIARVAAALIERIAAVDPANAQTYRDRGQAFQARWAEAIGTWERRATPLRGAKSISHERAMAYLNAWLGFVEVGTLQPKPGIPPTTSHLAGLLERVRADAPRFILLTPYDDPRPADWLAERAKIRSVVVPFTVGGTDAARDLYGLFEDTIRRLLESPK